MADSHVIGDDQALRIVLESARELSSKLRALEQYIYMFSCGVLLRCGWALSPALLLHNIQLYTLAGPMWSGCY